VRFFLDRAACIVVVSQRWSAWMHRVSRNRNVVVIAPPVMVPPPAATRDALLVVDLCDAKHAGSGVLQQAIARLRAAHPGLRVEHAHGLGPRARADLFARAAIAVLPDHAEGLPLRLLEAMAAGTAVVASAVGGVPDVVDSGFNGLLAPAGDVDVLAASIGRLLAQPALAHEMGRAARATIAHRFSPDSAMARVDRIYTELGVPRSRSDLVPGVPVSVLFPNSLTAARRLQENRA
jgi:glycosyltransferase involved in cell wall biosynthesis